MARHRSVSSYLAGEPVTLPGEFATAGALLAALGIEVDAAPAVLALAPGMALVVARRDADAQVALRWVGLERTPAWPGVDERIAIAVVLTAPIRRSDRIVRLASVLGAFARDTAFQAEARSARSREALVRTFDTAAGRVGDTALSADDILTLLGSARSGLATPETDRRRAAAGRNRLERVRRRPLVLRLLEQFWSFFAVLLWVGGALAIFAGMPQLGWAIFAVIVINGVFSFFQEYRAERALEALEQLLPHTIAVRRDGRECDAAAVDLVPGDVVRVDEGDQIPADGQLLTSEGLRVDQGSLTGESHPVFKIPVAERTPSRVPIEERPELLFAGTSVVAGAATYVVTATGMTTEIGTIARLTQAVTEEPSPLQREMKRVTRVVTVLAVAFGATFFLVGVVSGLMPPQQGFLFALGIIVANVPEGLLPTLTLALALGVQRMARLGSIVKRLSAVETLGAVAVVCTDKTGTLTENRLTTRSVWTSSGTSAPDMPSPALRGLLEAAVLASLATTAHGDPIERCLVESAGLAGVDAEALRGPRPVVAPLPFDSFRKRMTLVRAEPGAMPVAWVKGAPREMLALCTTIATPDGDRALVVSDRVSFLAEHDRHARQGMRMLAIARRGTGDAAAGVAAERVERDLVLIGLVALWDPPRDGVPAAVATCLQAGIRVVMVTGDYGLTAAAIAGVVGLPVSKIVTGEEVERMPPEALRDLTAEAGVLFARTNPSHKLAIVQALRSRGEVVAVTGDGVNDAPALKAADIGVAMGGRGSEVAKEAASMVVTDDNFASIVTAIRQGRSIYANIGRFVTYVLASNVPELVPFLVSVLARIPLPLTVMQVLAVDLGTDLLPALGLGAEAPEPGLMRRPPRDPHERLLSGARLSHAYGFLGVAEAALAMTAFFWTYHVAGWHPGLPMDGHGDLYRRATTMTFAGIVAAQVGNVLACRTTRASLFRVGVFGNRLVLLGIAAELALLVALIVIGPLARAFGFAPLRFEEWRIVLAFPFVILALEETRKWIARRRTPGGAG
jgi:calcium-translocating P-type ATPase